MGLGTLFVLSKLPRPLMLGAGRRVGGMVRVLVKSRRNVVATNIRLCFPQMPAAEQQQLVKAHFHSFGIGLLEIGLCWWGNPNKLLQLVTVNGFENFEKAKAEGGVILLSGHFTTLEVGGKLLAATTSIDAVFRPHENPVINWAMTHYRNKVADKAYERSDVRGLLKALKRGNAVWYAPDQAKKFKGMNVVAPFMGEPANTNTATGKLAKISGAKVIPYFCHRTADGKGYVLEFMPALEDFPAGEDMTDAVAVNEALAAQIRMAPEQYYWVHRKFKKRAGLADPY